MTKETAKIINEKIEKINNLLEEVASLGCDITNILDERYGINDYDTDKIPDEDNRLVYQHADNCGLINTWNEFNFGDLRCNADE